MGTNLRRLQLKIQGMNCGDCASNIERALKRREGIIKAKVDYPKAHGKVLYNPEDISKEQIAAHWVFKEPSQFNAMILHDDELGEA